MDFKPLLAAVALIGAAFLRVSQAASPGSLDPGFDPGTGGDDIVKRVLILPDAKVLLAGYFNHINGVNRAGIARLQSNGALDTAFDPGAGANVGLSALAVQPDGKILIGGEFTQFAGVG